MTAQVKRIYPESKTGLINWIEENFHDIDEYVFTCTLKGGTTMSVYDCYSYLSALGLAMMNLDSVQKQQDVFISKQKP